MVCLGNICRSPLAEGLLRSKLDPTKFTVKSAGTGHWHVGNPPDPRSIAVAKKNKIDISHQKGQQFNAALFDQYDHIFVMDHTNLRDVNALARTKEDSAKVSMILDELFPGEQVDVPDPYSGGPLGFDRIFKMLDEATDKLAQRLNS